MSQEGQVVGWREVIKAQLAPYDELPLVMRVDPPFKGAEPSVWLVAMLEPGGLLDMI